MGINYFLRKNTRNKCKKVYQNAEWCVETRNKVCLFVELTQFLVNYLDNYKKKCKFALQIKT